MDMSIFSTGTNIILITQSIMHLPEKNNTASNGRENGGKKNQTTQYTNKL